MRKLTLTRLVAEGLKKIVTAFALMVLPIAAWAQDAAADIVEAPKEFDPAQWDWSLIVSMILVVLVILVIVRSFDIGALTEKLTGKKVINWHKVNAWLALIVLTAGGAGVAYEMVYHGKHVLIGNAASEHGAALDSMFNWTFGFTFVVFCLTEVLLFVFMFRYRYREGKKAMYYFHNNKLELIWTTIPAIVLTFLVLRGFNTWSRITNIDKLPKDATTIEVFAYQFGWKARYAGDDNKFGQHHFTFISGKNPLGLAVTEYTDSLAAELKADIARIDMLIATAADSTIVWNKAYNDMVAKQAPNIAAFPALYKELRTKSCDANSGAYVRQLEKDKKRKTTALARIAAYRSNKDFFNNDANDDRVTTEIVLVKNKTYLFKFRARDVIHSAWMPEFRAQMNVVPGMSTHFAFTPTKTTAEARKAKNDSAYDYYLYCNKICGAAHYNMKIKITVVDSEAEYKTWLAAQPPVVAPAPVAAPPAEDPKKAADSASAKPTVATR